MQTNWTGDISDPAHFKIRERGDVLDRREGCDICPGVVPMEFLWDLITLHRPQQLVSAGVIASLDQYDLEADMRKGEWALFPSGDRVQRIDQSRTDLSEMVGRELHYLTRTFLRPAINGQDQVPAWEDLGKEWRGLWSQHVTRLLNTSYWGGVRGDWRFATELLKDTEQTLRGEYSVVDAALEAKLGLDTTHWEHPHAYDPWMDRLVRGRQVFDPLEDPTLPVPPQVGDMLERERAEARRHRRSRGSRVRVRQARPEQAPPARAPGVEGAMASGGLTRIRG